MNDLKVFSNFEFGELGVLIIDGKEWFPATQCAQVLGYKNPHAAILKHCKADGVVKHEGVSSTTNQHGVTTQQSVEINYINEGNLYRLIVHSKLPKAVEFEKWIFDTVLPSIRRNGGYVANAEELIAKTAAAVVNEVMKQLLPLFAQTSKNDIASNTLAVPKRRRTAPVAYVPPSKISTLSPDIKSMVDEMICSKMFSCQQIANFITNSCGMKISQMAVNRYAHSNFWDDDGKD